MHVVLNTHAHAHTHSDLADYCEARDEGMFACCVRLTLANAYAHIWFQLVVKKLLISKKCNNKRRRLSS